MTIILRGLTITIAEIEIHESPARPAGERPEPRGNEPAPAPLAASTIPGDGETPGAAVVPTGNEGRLGERDTFDPGPMPAFPRREGRSA